MLLDDGNNYEFFIATILQLTQLIGYEVFCFTYNIHKCV